MLKIVLCHFFNQVASIFHLGGGGGVFFGPTFRILEYVYILLKTSKVIKNQIRYCVFILFISILHISEGTPKKWHLYLGIVRLGAGE